MNLYAYVGNDPLNFVDPLGLYSTGTLSDRIANAFALVPETAYDVFDQAGGNIGIALSGGAPGFGVGVKVAIRSAPALVKDLTATVKGLFNKEVAKNVFNIDSNQLGKKLGKHVQDFGGNPSSAVDRQRVIDKINNIANNPDKVISGTFKGQGPNNTRGAVNFRIRGNDVVVTKPDGSFITILKDGINNTSVKNALGGK